MARLLNWIVYYSISNVEAAAGRAYVLFIDPVNLRSTSNITSEVQMGGVGYSAECTWYVYALLATSTHIFKRSQLVDRQEIFSAAIAQTKPYMRQFILFRQI